MSDVKHLANQQQFIIDHEGGTAVLSYRLFNNGAVPAVDFTSTYVPPEFRGKGLAEKLVRAALTWAKSEGYELHASCWYVAKFLR